VHHDTVTRDWTVLIDSGTPVGAQVAWPPCTTSGWFIDVTRCEPVVHDAVAHGPPALGGNEQPLIVYGVGSSTTALPPTVTRW
jgi:hypothetical protein